MSASIFQMSGADLSAALAIPAALSQAVAYPGASVSLNPILSAIAGLSRGDQAALMRAFRKAAPVAVKQKQIGGSTFRGWADFTPALNAAQVKAIEAFGRQWYLSPDLCVKARVPSAWASCKISLRTSCTPRDMNLPAAQFWPGGILPTGPDYAAPYQIDPSGDVRVTKQAKDARRAAFQADCPEWHEEMRADRQAPEFALEHPPEDIGIRNMESV